MRGILVGTAFAAACAALAIGAPAGAQGGAQQTVTPPNQVYWMSVTTNSGLSSFSTGDVIGGLFGGGGAPGASSSARMLLQLGSKDAPAKGGPNAAHTVPASARIGPQLPLRTLTREPGRESPRRDEIEQPKGRLLLFFGCGERAKPGQPIVFDFARIAAGQLPKGLESRVRAARAPEFRASAWRTYGEWPNDAATQGVALPAGASLLGEHLVRGNYTPDIRFNLTPGHDVMAPFTFTANQIAASGAVPLTWRAIPTATAYGLFAFGQGRASENDMVMWTSSELASFDQGMDYLPPAEAARLVRERVLLSPQTTTCTVPQEVTRAMRQEGGTPSGMLFAAAFGPEQNIVFPARPTDPRTPWNQQWAVKARFSSSTIEGLGMSFSAMMAGRGGAGEPGGPGAAPARPLTQEEICKRREEERRAQSRDVGRAVGGALGIPGGDIVGGLFGGAQKAPTDPECPAPGAPAKKR